MSAAFLADGSPSIMAAESRTCTQQIERTRTSKVLWLCLIALVLCTLTLAAVHGTDDCPYDPDGCPLCQLAYGAKLESPMQFVNIGVNFCRPAIGHVRPPCLEESIRGWESTRAPPSANCTGR